MHDPVPIALTPPPAELDRRKDCDYLCQYPSMLLHYTLEDLDKALESNKYRFNFDNWHRPSSDGYTYICLAGARMAMTLGTDARSFAEPGFFSKNERRIATGLSFLAGGHVHYALAALPTPRAGRSQPPINHYYLGDHIRIRDYSAWRKGLDTLARSLAASGY